MLQGSSFAAWIKHTWRNEINNMCCDNVNTVLSILSERRKRWNQWTITADHYTDFYLLAKVGQASSKLHQRACWPSSHSFSQVGNFIFISHHSSDVQMGPMGSCDKLSQECSCCARTSRTTKEQSSWSGACNDKYVLLTAIPVHLIGAERARWEQSDTYRLYLPMLLRSASWLSVTCLV